MGVSTIMVRPGEEGPGHASARRRADVWRATARIVDRAPLLADLRNHGIELLAARVWRDSGRPVPPELVVEERQAAALTLGAPAVLARAREAYDGGLLLLKGPEVARLYPDPALRRFRDLDLLVEDAGLAYRSLLGAGFEPVGDPALYAGIHHLRPLAHPALPLPVELHSRLKWIPHVAPPAPSALFETAVAGNTGVDGVVALPPSYHAVTLAVHSWAHQPLRRVRDILDIAVTLAEGDRDEAEAVARAWGVGRLWRTTVRALDAVVADGRRDWNLRTWARNLPRVRERTVLENHLERWLSSFAVLPPGRAVRDLAHVLAREVRPEGDESWSTKLARTRAAVRDASVRRSEHEEDFRRRAGEL